MPTPLAGAGGDPGSMRRALYRAKTFLEAELVAIQDAPPTNEYYVRVENLCALLDVIFDALGEPISEREIAERKARHAAGGVP